MNDTGQPAIINPEAAEKNDEQDWRWQMRNSISSSAQIAQLLNLSEDETKQLQEVCEIFPLQITPYYAKLIDSSDPNDPIRNQIVPDKREINELKTLAKIKGQTLQEYIAGLVCDGRVGGWDNPEQFIDREHTVEQKYPNRVAWLITKICPAWCRHCVRRVMSKDSIAQNPSPERLGSAIKAITEKQEVNDVLITGGDAFMVPTQTVDDVLTRLLAIDHITSVRFGTRTPVTLPQRITSDPELIEVLKRHTEEATEQGKIIWVNTQFNHPNEITPESKAAIKALRSTGCELGNQSVLMRDVNNDIEILEILFGQLSRLGVRPYYLYQGIPTAGTNFRYTTVSEGLGLMRQMYERQNLSGFEKPRYILADSEQGKIPLPPPGVSYEITEERDEQGVEYEVFKFPWKGAEVEYKSSK